MCKKQTSVSHSFTESEIIWLDAGLRMDGLFALVFMGRGDRSVTFIEKYQNHQPIPQQETVRADTNPTPNRREPEMLSIVACGLRYHRRTPLSW